MKYRWSTCVTKLKAQHLREKWDVKLHALNPSVNADFQKGCAVWPATTTFFLRQSSAYVCLRQELMSIRWRTCQLPWSDHYMLYICTEMLHCAPQICTVTMLSIKDKNNSLTGTNNFQRNLFYLQKQNKNKVSPPIMSMCSQGLGTQRQANMYSRKGQWPEEVTHTRSLASTW